MVVVLACTITYSFELMAAQMVATISPVVQTQMPIRRVTALYSARSGNSIAPSSDCIVTYFSHGMN